MQYKFLKELSEHTIFDFYYAAIMANNYSEFKDFTTAHRDAYIRLRSRAENSRASIEPQS